jgi:hypothetical protein
VPHEQLDRCVQERVHPSSSSLSMFLKGPHSPHSSAQGLPPSQDAQLWVSQRILDCLSGGGASWHPSPGLGVLLSVSALG